MVVDACACDTPHLNEQHESNATRKCRHPAAIAIGITHDDRSHRTMPPHHYQARCSLDSSTKKPQKYLHGCGSLANLDNAFHGECSFTRSKSVFSPRSPISRITSFTPLLVVYALSHPTPSSPHLELLEAFEGQSDLPRDEVLDALQGRQLLH